MISRTFEGFETFTNDFKMALKMHVCIIIAIFVAQIFLLVAQIDFRSPETLLTIGWYKANILASIPLELKTKIVLYDFIHEDYAKNIIQIEEIKHLVSKQNLKQFQIFKMTCLLYLFYPVTIIYFRRRSKKQSTKKHIRGARLVTAKELSVEFKKNKDDVDLPLGSIKKPIRLENRQTMFIGMPGSGKTQALRKILKRLIERQEKGICYCNKGDYVSEFYDPGIYLIFNPLDQRSLGWNIFNELESYPDIDAVAASLIPPSKASTDPFWNDAARGVFSGISHYLYQNDMKNNKELWKMLTADAGEIAEKLRDTRGGEAGYRYITQNAKSSRQADSVLAVMMQYTKCFEYMQDNDGKFSINDWLDNGTGFIYITNYDVIEETLRPILSLFVDLICRKLLSLPDSEERRIYLHLDEFASLQRLSTLINLLTKGRSKGACVYLGIQDGGQMEKIYTPELRKSIDNACGNRVTYALSGDTAEVESRYNIGESEYYETNRSMSMGPHSMRDGISLQKHIRKAPLFLPADISNLQDLNAIVRLKNYDFVLSEWRYERPEQIHTPFVLREDLKLENILKEIAKVKKESLQVKNENDDLNIEPITA